MFVPLSAATVEKASFSDALCPDSVMTSELFQGYSKSNTLLTVFTLINYPGESSVECSSYPVSRRRKGRGFKPERTESKELIDILFCVAGVYSFPTVISDSSLQGTVSSLYTVRFSFIPDYFPFPIIESIFASILFSARLLLWSMFRCV
jgi:hypothetical protein